MFRVTKDPEIGGSSGRKFKTWDINNGMTWLNIREQKYHTDGLTVWKYEADLDGLILKGRQQIDVS